MPDAEGIEMVVTLWFPPGQSIDVALDILQRSNPFQDVGARTRNRTMDSIQIVYGHEMYRGQWCVWLGSALLCGLIEGGRIEPTY
jgi:hypothetical protein